MRAEDVQAASTISSICRASNLGGPPARSWRRRRLVPLPTFGFASFLRRHRSECDEPSPPGGNSACCGSSLRPSSCERPRRSVAGAAAQSSRAPACVSLRPAKADFARAKLERLPTCSVVLAEKETSHAFTQLPDRLGGGGAFIVSHVVPCMGGRRKLHGLRPRRGRQPNPPGHAGRQRLPGVVGARRTGGHSGHLSAPGRGPRGYTVARHLALLPSGGGRQRRSGKRRLSEDIRINRALGDQAASAVQCGCGRTRSTTSSRRRGSASAHVWTPAASDAAPAADRKGHPQT